jgi:hypothetical protein
MNDDLSKQLFAIAGRKDAEGKADTEPGPDADGVYPVEVVEDDEPSSGWPAVAAPGAGARS